MGRRFLTLEERQRGKVLGNAIAAARHRMSITQTALASAAKIDIDALRGLEQGKYAHPSFFTVLDIATALEISLKDLRKLKKI